MRGAAVFARLVRFVARRPIPVLAGVGILDVLAAVYALRLQPSASTDKLVNRSSASFKDTERFKREFGDDAVVVLVKANLQRTLLTSDLRTLIELEVRQLVYAQFVQQTLQLALRYGLTGLPAINNTEFVSQLMFDSSKGVNVPKARFAYLVPSPDAALVQVRLKPGLSDKQRRNAIGLIEKSTKDKFFKMQNGQQYIVSGVPVVADALASSVQHAVVVLLIAVLIVMAATLALVFRARLRMLPLALALAAAALAFGVVALV